MNPWKEDFIQLLRLFHRDGKPRVWVFAAVSIIGAGFLVFSLFSLFGKNPNEATVDEPISPTVEPTETGELSLVLWIQESVKQDWRNASLPGCSQGLTSGVPRGEDPSAYLNRVESALQHEEVTVKLNADALSLSTTSEHAKLRVEGTAIQICVKKL